MTPFFFGRLKKTTYPDGSYEEYGYDANGNKTSFRNREGETISYTYDALNRMTIKTYPDSSTINYFYDLGGRFTEVTDTNGAILFSYDSVDRVTDVAYPESLALSYQYDENGNWTHLSYPSGIGVSRTFDSLNRLDQVKDSQNNVLADYTYDNLSRRTQVDYLNGTRTTYTYDSINRLTELVNKKVSPETIFSQYQYTSYDNLGNLEEMNVPAGVQGEGTYYYGYDKTYQLTTVNYPAWFSFSDTTYNYDPLGNWTTVTDGGSNTYTANNLNQYTAVDAVSLTYDGNGNLTFDGTNTYYYDSENRMTKAATASNTYYYEYDPFGKRIEKTGGGSTVKYIYEGDRVIEERDGNNDLVARYIYGSGLDEVLTMDRDSDTYYYHYDRLGSVVNLSNAAGDSVETYYYDVFGESNNEGSVGNPYFFTGRRYINETGIYYYRARMYSPYIGRFLQVDPLGNIDSNNLYSYCLNSPLSHTDPKGQRPVGFSGCSKQRETMIREQFRKMCDKIKRNQDDLACCINSTSLVTCLKHKCDVSITINCDTVGEGECPTAYAYVPLPPFRPTIILCEIFWGITPNLQQGVLAHELSHLCSRGEDTSYRVQDCVSVLE